MKQDSEDLPGDSELDALLLDSLLIERHLAEPLGGDDTERLVASVRSYAEANAGTSLEHSGLGTDRTAERRERSPEPQSGRRWSSLQHAAWLVPVVLLLGVAGASIKERLSGEPAAVTAAEVVAHKVYTTRPGQRAILRLDDGTRVTLNVASTLEVARNFGVSNRSVRVVGQAVFEVAQSSSAPFVVDAAGVRSTVLGTVFGVRAYDGSVKVSVRSGKVSVASCDVAVDGSKCAEAHGSVVLAENDAAIATASGRLEVRHNQNVAADLAFTEGRLVLTGAPLRDVVEELNRWYDADVQLMDAQVGNLALEGSFPAGGIGNLVQALEVVLKAKVERDGRVIRIGAPATPINNSPR